MRRGSAFWPISALIVVKTILFAVVLPPWQGPDEPFHFKIAYVLAHPMTDIQKLDSRMVSSLRKYRFREYTNGTQSDSRVPELDTHKFPGYYVVLAFLFKFFSGLGLSGKMFLGRLFSAACYLFVVLLVYVMSRRVFAGAEGHWVSIAALSFVGLHPQYSFFSITLNSDNLITLLLTVILFCLVHMSSRGQEAADTGMPKYWPWFVAILAVLIGLLVKRTGFVGFALFCVSVPIIMYKDRRSLTKAGLVVMALLALAVLFVFFSGSAQDRNNKDLNQFSISFDGVSGDVRVSYQAFDIDSKREVVVLLNGKKVANVKRTKNNKWGATRSLILPDKLVKDNRTNTLTFDNVRNPPRRNRWGVRNVQVGDIVKVEHPRGKIPRSKMLEGLIPGERKRLAKECRAPVVAKWSARIGKTIREGLIKLRDASDVPFHLIIRFILVQFVSFWFSLGWMIYKMSLGWYMLFSLITLLSFGGLLRLIYEGFRNRNFEFINMRVVSLLILLFALSQVAMVVAYAPSHTSSINSAMGRCRFMEIGALSILIPLGLWAISPARRRDMVMKSFVCFMIFLNMVSVIKYIIPIFYL